MNELDWGPFQPHTLHHKTSPCEKAFRYTTPVIQQSNQSPDGGPQCPQRSVGKNGTQRNEGRVSHVCVVSVSPRTISSPNMMPAAEGMTHMIPNHVLRVGQTIRLDPAPETTGRHDDCGDRDLDISLENLNRIILELDPTFEPLPLDKSAPSTSPPAGRGTSAKPLRRDTFFSLCFCLWSLLHRKKMQTQTIAATVVQRYDVQPLQNRSPGLGNKLVAWGFAERLYFGGIFIVLIPVVVTFSQLLWDCCSDRYHTLCKTQRITRSATGCPGGAGSSYVAPAASRVCGKT